MNSFLTHLLIAVLSFCSITLIVLFFLICYSMFFKTKKIEETLSNYRIQFAVIVSVISSIALILTIYSNVLFDNDNNLGSLIIDSFRQVPKQNIFETETEEGEGIKYIICIDVSGSSQELIPPELVPTWLNAASFKSLCNQFNISFNEVSSITNRIKNKKISNCLLQKILSLKMLSKLSDGHNDDVFQILSFGENATLIFPPDEYQFKEATPTFKNQAAEIILDLKCSDKNTDFLNLFNTLLLKNSFRARNSYKINRYNIVILSDFINDTGNTDDRNEYEENVKEINKLLLTLSQKNASFKIALLKSSINSKSSQYKYQITEQLKSIFNKFNVYYSEHDITNENIEIHNIRISKSKIEFLYSSNLMEKTSSKIANIPIEYPEGKAWFKLFNYDNSVFNQFFFKNGWTGENTNEWVKIYANQLYEIHNIRKKDFLELRYEGGVYHRFPNYYISIYIPDLKKEIITEIVFKRRIPLLIGIILTSLLALLFIFEVKFLNLLRKAIFAKKV